MVDDERRNYLLIFIDPSLFTIGMTFLSINAVITYFLAYLGASTFEIGLANALVSIGAFVSQPFFANKVVSLPYKLRSFTRILYTQRFFLLSFILAIPFLAKSRPHTMVIVFLISWGIFNLFVGSYGTFYTSLFAKMIADQQRGKLRGFSIALGNLLALGASYVTAVLLKDLPFPYNYTVIFGLGAIFLIIDVVAFALMKENPDQVSEVKINYVEYFRRIPVMLRQHPHFRQIVMGSAFIVISQVGLSYYALYAIRIYHTRTADIALFTAVTGVVNILGNVAFGLLADKYGHRLILILSSLSGALGGFLVIGVHQLWAVYVAFGLANVCLSGYNLSSGILMIENIHRDELPMAVSINALITLTLSSVCILGGSIFIERVSFSLLFLLTGIAGLLAYVVFQRFRGVPGGMLGVQDSA